LKADVLESGAGRSCCPYDCNIERYGGLRRLRRIKIVARRSKQEYLRQVRKLGEHYAGRELAGVTEREVFD